jgi:hypothetical protein
LPGSSTAATSSSARRSTSETSYGQSFPETFSVPQRYAKHMMIVADIEAGNANAVEDAIIGAWEL